MEAERSLNPESFSGGGWSPSDESEYDPYEDDSFGDRRGEDE